MAMPAEKPPSAIRTVLPACRARRSRAHASRASKAFSARTARRGGVGNTEKGSIDASQAGLPQARPIKRTNPEFTGSGVRLPRSEEHTSELQSLMRISYAVFCLKKKKEKLN